MIKLPDTLIKNNLKSVLKNNSKFVIEKLFHLSDASKEEVSKVMQNIKISKAVCIDKLSQNFLKGGTEILSRPVSEICNLFNYQLQPFANVSEVAKRKTLLEKDKTTDSTNSKTISLLPLISKTFERAILDQTNASPKKTIY